ncbi:MAG TPA: OadG family protein [Bacillota bacterium]|nr:OadG family protein [Bacillota bacterium]HPZ90057.1 OadG family protein [Bacillota bacterium]HQE01003.1 OadG family protein [Bacillota bacterium]
MDLQLGLLITVIGMGIVFASLFALAEIIKIPKVLVSPKVSGKEVHVAQSDSPSRETTIPPQHIAAIAAVVAALDQPYRIRVIDVLGNENWERSRYTDITSLN